MSQQEVSLPLLSETSKSEFNLRGTFGASACLLCCGLLAALTFLTDYTEEATDKHVDQYYMWYVHVAVMVFVGFGFLMTFLRAGCFSAVGLNFFLSALVMLEAILVVGGIQQGLLTTVHAVAVDLPLLIDSAFAAGAAMISFGALLGKASPGQLLWLVVLETPLYALNAHFVEELKALDVGGSMTIHAFGAYFGLAASMFISKKGSGAEHAKNGSTPATDITAMIGTLFLWIFWPSFNGALASNPEPLTKLLGHHQVQLYCVLNTVLSLLGACIATFAADAMLHNKFNMVHIQNATLAGGVAIGSAANLRVTPGGAVGVGMFAGIISTLGYMYVQPALEAGIGLRDTCGVHNLHGMPGVLGGLVAALTAWLGYSSNQAVLEHGPATPVYQLAALGLTLALALAGGALSGVLVSRCGVPGQSLDVADMYEDATYWFEADGGNDD